MSSVSDHASSTGSVSYCYMTSVQGHDHDPLRIVIIEVNRAAKPYRDALLWNDVLKPMITELFEEAHGAKLCVRPQDAERVLAHLRQNGFVHDGTGKRMFLRNLHYKFMIVAAEYEALVRNVLDGIPKRHRTGPKTVAVFWMPPGELQESGTCRIYFISGIAFLALS